MEFDGSSTSYVYSGGAAGAVRSMNDLDTLDELKGMLEAYFELDDYKAVQRVIKRIEERIARIVQEAIL